MRIVLKLIIECAGTYECLCLYLYLCLSVLLSDKEELVGDYQRIKQRRR